MSNATLVTIDRVIEAMSGHGIEVSDDPSGRAGHANVDGYNLLFVLLDSVLIVRADAVTDTPADTPDATLYLAANQVNSSYLDARALVVNRTENIVVRTEAEIQVGAGLSEEQLSHALKAGVDGVLETQDAMRALVSEIQHQAEAAGVSPEQEPGADR
mgnify:FL=1